MTQAILILLGTSLLAYLVSGARTSAYLLYFLGYVPFMTIDASAGGLTDVGGLGGENVLFKLGFRALTTAGFLVLFLRRRESVQALLRPRSFPVLFFFCWALLSLHRAQSPWVSLFRLGEFFTFFLAGVVLFTESSRFHPPRRVARWHCLALLQIVLVSIWFMSARPELAFHVSSTGVARLGHKFMNANSLGFAAAVVLLWATFELREPREGERSFLLEKLLPLACLCAASVVLYLARSRTATIAVVAGQAVLWFPFFRGNARYRVPLLLCLLAGAIVVLTRSDSISGWFLRDQSLEEIRGGAGRLGLWGALLSEQVPRAPILGQGYLMLSERGLFMHHGSLWNNAHNTYMFALVSNGIPGLLAILAIVGTPLACLFRRVYSAPMEERSGWILLFALQSMIALVGVAEFGVNGYPNPAMFLHYTLFAYAVARPRGAPAPAREARLRPFPPAHPQPSSA